MKIIVFNNLYKPFARGGAERIVERLAEEFSAQGHETLIVTSLPLGEKRPTAPSVEYFSGLPAWYYHLDRLPKALRLLYHLFGYIDPFVYLRTRKLLRDFQPDLVITNNLLGLGLSVMRAIKRGKAKHVHILHDIQLLHPSGLLMWGQESLIQSSAAKRYQALNDTFFNKTSLVVSPSKWLLDLHLKQGLFKQVRHAVMANPANFKSVSREEHQVPTIIDCLFVGQLESHKGIGFLLASFEKMSGNHRLRIIGSGSQESLVLAAIKQNQRIAFLGRLSPDQVAEEMSRASVLILPSLCYENSPTVIYEAMSQGLPIVAADLGGIPELIVDKQNLFIPGNSQSLIDTLSGPYNRHQALPADKSISAKQYVEALIEKIKPL